MHHFGYYIGVPKHIEILCIAITGIVIYGFYNESLFNLRANYNTVWSMTMNMEKIPEKSQNVIKYLISTILLIKACSDCIYLVFYIVMLWPAIFEERPALLLPWLIIGAIEGLCLGVFSFGFGAYVCFIYRIHRVLFYEFSLTKLLENVPFAYVYFCVLSFYRDLKKKSFMIRRDLFDPDLISRRRKVRTLTDSLFLKHVDDFKKDDRNLLSVSTIENIVNHMNADLSIKNTMSWDSLISAKTSLSQEESSSTYDDFFENETDLSITEKASKILNLTEEDIENARKEHLLPKDLFTDSMMKIDNIDNTKRDIKIKMMSTLKNTYSHLETQNPKNCYNFESKSLEKVKSNRSTFSNRSLSSSKKLPKPDLINTTKAIGVQYDDFIGEQDFVKRSMFETISLANQEVCRLDKEINYLKTPEKNQLETSSSNETQSVSSRTDRKIRVPSLSTYKKKFSDCSCEVSTLSKSILNATPEELEILLSNHRKSSKKIDLASQEFKQNQNFDSDKKSISIMTDQELIESRSVGMMTELSDSLDDFSNAAKIDKTETLPRFENLIFGEKSSFRSDGFTVAFKKEMNKKL